MKNISRLVLLKCRYNFALFKGQEKGLLLCRIMDTPSIRPGEAVVMF